MSVAPRIIIACSISDIRTLARASRASKALSWSKAATSPDLAHEGHASDSAKPVRPHRCVYRNDVQCNLVGVIVWVAMDSPRPGPFNVKFSLVDDKNMSTTACSRPELCPSRIAQRESSPAFSAATTGPVDFSFEGGQWGRMHDAIGVAILDRPTYSKDAATSESRNAR